MFRSLCLFAIATWPALVIAQETSLKDIAREHGGQASNSSDVELPSASLATLVAGADYIVEARVLTKRGVLSRDEARVCTQYDIQPFRTFKDRIGVAVRSKPGQGMKLVVSQPGGRVTVDGLELESTNNLFPVEGLDVGATFLMFLHYNAEEGMFDFLHGPFGVYVLEGRSLLPSTQPAARNPYLLPTDSDQVDAEITRLLSSSHR
jgi:hypothetical protein